MRYAVPANIAYVIADEQEPLQVFVTQLPDGPPLVLQGGAAVIWLVATEAGDGDVVTLVAELVGKVPEEIAAETSSCLRDLVDRGLLELELLDT